MIDIPVENFVFLVCTLVGGGLLLLTVLLDDILGAIFDFDIAGTSLMPLLLAFISMFGVGGLFATQILDLHGGQAALVGTIFGLAGMAVAWVMFTMLRRAQADEPFSIKDLIGDDAYVAVGIPAGRYGSVLVKKEGQTHEYSATATTDIASGATARVAGIAGAGLIVEPLTPPIAGPPPTVVPPVPIPDSSPGATVADQAPPSHEG
jgi:membrane protein implicated in regulation of membrane protease activity